MTRSPETRKKISTSRVATAHKIADAYAALGFPETKRCTHPDCEQKNPQPIENFTVRPRRWKDGRTIYYPTAYCRKCTNRIRRARRAKLKKENPELLKKKEKKWRENHLEKVGRAAHQEYQRIWADGQRRANGVPQRNWKSRSVTDGTPDVRLPLTQEFSEYLDAQNVSKLEQDLELAPGALAHYARGRHKTIALGLADRLLYVINDGTRLDHFWPHI